MNYLAFHALFKWIIKIEYLIRVEKSKKARMDFGWIATPESPYPWDKMSRIDQYFFARGYATK